jgi:hypothetical protein
MKLAVICDGISYPVEAVCTSEREANALCGLNPSLSVMGEDGSGRCYLVSGAKPDAHKLMPFPTVDKLKRVIANCKCSQCGR